MISPLTALALGLLALMTANSQAQNAPAAPSATARGTPTAATSPATPALQTPAGTSQPNKPAMTGLTPAARMQDAPAAKAAQPALDAAAKTPTTNTPALRPPGQTVEPLQTAPKEAGNSAPLAAKKSARAPPCPVSEFRALGMETSNAEQRRSKALDWLAKKGNECTAEKLVAIRNNRAQWMGVADSTVVAAAVDSLLEASAENNPAVINLLYGTAPPPPKPPEEKKPNSPPS